MAVNSINNADKKFTLYLSFKNKETAEKWLIAHGIDAKFTATQIMPIKVVSEENARKEEPAS